MGDSRRATDEDPIVKCTRLEHENQLLRSLLREHGIAIPGAAKPDPLPPVSLKTLEKVALFRSLFRGREDVYARRWESPDGRVGYSPRTERDWKAYYAAKPDDRKRVDKDTRKNIPLDDEAIHAHLSGKQTLGVYPLLLDDTCWFLAADFDKKTWKEDAAAFRETCNTLDVPASVECSRSGKGAHIWIFFERPVPASIARRLGSLLLTRTMERRHQLGVDSYDGSSQIKTRCQRADSATSLRYRSRRFPANRAAAFFSTKTATVSESVGLPQIGQADDPDSSGTVDLRCPPTR